MYFSGPTDRTFERFRESYPHIPANPHLKLWTWPDITPPHTFLTAKALEVLAFCQRHLQTEAFGRDDYRELCELIIEFLGGQVC